MTVERKPEQLQIELKELRSLPAETEWVEFKKDNKDPQEIGEYISALANSAALIGKVTAWLVWGVDDETHAITGTEFRPEAARKGNEELESWLLRQLTPKINFRFHTLPVDDKIVIMLEISAASQHPVQFATLEYIRVGSYKKRLKDYPEKERELWRIFDTVPFEKQVAAENVPVEDVLRLLDYPVYFDLLEIPLPEGRDGILAALETDGMLQRHGASHWNITNLGAILFAKRLGDFHHLGRKAVRVIHYNGEDRIGGAHEQVGTRGFAAGFEGLIGFITARLPVNEVIGKALRKDVPMFPEIAIRELVANAIIHQDFHSTGTSTMIEIFASRMEITNPGLPLVKPDRFLDSPPRSRNEALASFMRRIGICEERGSGVDKVVSQTELYQLPAPLFETTDEHTRAVLFAHKDLKDMDRDDRIRACYLHACLKHVQRDYMTNTSLRERFGIDDKNSAVASRIIKDTLEAGYIRAYDEDAGRKFMRYVPRWA